MMRIYTSSPRCVCLADARSRSGKPFVRQLNLVDSVSVPRVELKATERERVKQKTDLKLRFTPVGAPKQIDAPRFAFTPQHSNLNQELPRKRRAPDSPSTPKASAKRHKSAKADSPSVVAAAAAKAPDNKSKSSTDTTASPSKRKPHNDDSKSPKRDKEDKKAKKAKDKHERDADADKSKSKHDDKSKSKDDDKSKSKDDLSVKKEKKDKHERDADADKSKKKKKHRHHGDTE